MPGNPLIDQGTLNRIKASVVIPNFPNLNVTAPYLGKEQISLALEGDSVLYIPNSTGATTSPEPYMMASITVDLLKPQALAGQFKAQMESLATIGTVTVRPDVATGLPPYTIINCSISAVRDMKFNGTESTWVITLKGYYLVNSGLFN